MEGSPGQHGPARGDGAGQSPVCALKAGHPIPSQFSTTHWSVVLAAGQVDSPQAAEALERLCRTYWYPLYAYVRRRGYTVEEAQDLTQEFFWRLLARHAFEHQSLFHLLQPCLTGAEPTLPYAAMAAESGLTEPAVKMAVHRLRQHYGQLLRAELMQLVDSPEDVDEEIHHLIAVATR